MLNIDNFSSLSTEDLVQALSISLYDPPLSRIQATLSFQPEVLRVLMLVVDFDTEVSINGILGFLENSTGQWLTETIQAFDLISARETADILPRVRDAMNRHGISSLMLHSEVNAGTLHSVSSFRERHGANSEGMTREVMQIASGLYVGNPSVQEEPWSLLCEYVGPRRQQLLDALGQT